MMVSLYVHEAIDRRPSTRATRPDHHEYSLPPTAILLRSNHASQKEQMSGGPVEEDQVKRPIGTRTLDVPKMTLSLPLHPEEHRARKQ